jgi:hypothetical protein
MGPGGVNGRRPVPLPDRIHADTARRDVGSLRNWQAARPARNRSAPDAQLLNTQRQRSGQAIQNEKVLDFSNFFKFVDLPWQAWTGRCDAAPTTCRQPPKNPATLKTKG